MTNIAKLKSRGGKGTPPQMQSKADPIEANPRPKSMGERPLQVRIPIEIFEEFSALAGKEFGFEHGAKKKLFLKMWAEFSKS